MAIISSPHLARWAQLDQNLLAWLEKSALGHTNTDGIPLRLSQLGYFTIQDILLFDPDDLHEDLKEYESSAGTVEILKGQRLKFLRSRCYLLEKFLDGDTEGDIANWDPDDIVKYIRASAGVDKQALQNRYMRSQATQPGQAALTYKEQLIEFTKTRKDSSNLKTWKEDSQFTTFYEDLKLEAADALCSRIIDPTFDPSVINDPADQKLFDKQCTYMAKVLRAKITATKARRFIDTAKKVDRPDLYWKLIYKAYTESDLATTYGGHVLAAMQEL